MARKKIDDGGGGPSWLDTYADMVTLLLTFFVMLFAMSNIDSTKWKELVKAFAGPKPTQTQANVSINESDIDVSNMGFPVSSSEVSQAEENQNIHSAQDVKNFNDLYWYVKNYVNRDGLNASIDVYKGKDYTFIVFQNRIFFDGNSSDIRNEGKEVLDFLSDGLKSVSDQIGEIRVYGHTAETSDSWKTEQRVFDRNLSSQRANNVLLYIDLKNIIDSGKMVAEGYGEFRPLVPHDGTEDTRIKNRRVELYISQSGSTESKLDTVYSEINAAKGKR